PSVGLDTVSVTYCNAAGDMCSDTLDLVILSRRAGQKLFPAGVLLGPEEVTNVTVPAGQLPGELQCNFFLDCADNYAGRDQRAYFTDYSQPVNTLVYEASRFRGVDSLCVVLCDEYGICDTAHLAFRVQVPSSGLPFMDDFSYTGPTNEALWLDNEVYLNNSMPINPPSLGVATFDGIDYKGQPYGGDYDTADRLTSTYLNISPNEDAVLTFWLQRGGLADRPETQDSLVLEFTNEDGEWEFITSFEGMPANQPIAVRDTLFSFYRIPIDEDYRHPDFQFRFSNFGDRQGLRDVWHLDYVRLGVGANQVDTFFNDLAFTQLPAPILKDYTSMPFRHFQATQANELADSLVVGVYNHSSQTLNASPSSVMFQELNSNVTPFNTTPTLFNGLDINIPNQMPVNRVYRLQADPNGFPSVWADYVSIMEGTAFDAFDELEFRMTYTLSNAGQIQLPGFEDVQRNDQVTQTTYFSDYFAYDDGTAESAVETSAGKQVAVAFVAGVPDTLRGVRIHFPHTSEDVSEQFFRLRVWIGQLDGSPEYDVVYSPAYASSYFDTLQGFTTYPLVDMNGNLAPLPLPVDSFFVGWQQLTNCDISRCIGIGYDRNRPQAYDFIYVNNGAGWQPISALSKGALMLRPIVSGDAPVLPTDVVEIPINEEDGLTVFPNPLRDRLQLRWADGLDRKGSMLLYNSAGQLLRRAELATEWNLYGLTPGLYFLEVVTDGGRTTVRKKVVVLP
ncbi:MAG: T9SS type A sorting domain-containing protein, partial [Lewinella sp.]|nr:T9SS type A sorting domain-containing protein [Lewinella sp.]